MNIEPTQAVAPVKPAPLCCRCRSKPAVRGTYPPVCPKCAALRAREDAIDRKIAAQFDPSQTGSFLKGADDGT